MYYTYVLINVLHVFLSFQGKTYQIEVGRSAGNEGTSIHKKPTLKQWVRRDFVWRKVERGYYSRFFTHRWTLLLYSLSTFGFGKKIIKYKTLLWKMYSTPPPTLLWNVELLNDSAKTASCAPQDKQILYPQKSFENTVAQQPYWPIFKNFFLEYFTAFMTSSQYIRIHFVFLYFFKGTFYHGFVW